MNRREDGATTCGDCRFWARGQRDNGFGECLLASGDMAIGNGAEPGMRTALDGGARRTHVLDDAPVALLITESGFSCVHAEARGDAEPEEAAERRKPGARRGARFGGAECSWEETIPGEYLHRCRNLGLEGPGHPSLIGPSCPECPFRQEGALLTPIVNGEGEIIAQSEREYVGRHLSRAMDNARDALEEAARLEYIIRVLEGRHEEAAE